jgi:glutamate-5-semialdehyde dehydrogenase
MTAPLKAVDRPVDIAAMMGAIGRQARAAARVLALADTARKDAALKAMGKALRTHEARILAANADDLAEAVATGATAAFLDRLSLDHRRVAAMGEGLEVVRELADPVGAVTEAWTGRTGCGSSAYGCRSGWWA